MKKMIKKIQFYLLLIKVTCRLCINKIMRLLIHTLERHRVVHYGGVGLSLSLSLSLSLVSLLRTFHQIIFISHKSPTNALELMLQVSNQCVNGLGLSVFVFLQVNRFLSEEQIHQFINNTVLPHHRALTSPKVTFFSYYI